MQLSDFFAEHPRVAVAFSGGVDSAYLLYAAKTAGCDVHAYFIHSQFQPRFELDDTQRFVEMLHVPLTVLDCDVLSDPAVCANDTLRCYYCKRALFTRLWQAARADGYDVLCDGTNASDEAADRPGMRALDELEVLSPLRTVQTGRAFYARQAGVCLPCDTCPDRDTYYTGRAWTGRTRGKRAVCTRIYRFSRACSGRQPCKAPGAGCAACTYYRTARTDYIGSFILF